MEKFTLDAKSPPGRNGLAIAFTVWGSIGLFFNAILLLGIVFSSSVGVGTSAYVAAVATIWIGGMVFFGFAAILITPGYAHNPTGSDQRLIEDYYQSANAAAVQRTPVAPIKNSQNVLDLPPFADRWAGQSR